MIKLLLNFLQQGFQTQWNFLKKASALWLPYGPALKRFTYLSMTDCNCSWMPMKLDRYGSWSVHSERRSRVCKKTTMNYQFHN
jgi:hypothetical protein